MRAGQYAVVDGVEYQAKFLPGDDSIVLVLAPGQQPPAGVAARRYYDGSLLAEVPRARMSRPFEAETWALLHGRFPPGPQYAPELTDGRVFRDWHVVREQPGPVPR